MVRTGVAVLATLLAFAVPATAGASGTGKPSMRIQQFKPLRLTGRNFKADERVTVVAEYRNARYVRKLTASASGTFVAVFPNVRVSRCGSDLHLRATGARGSRVEFTLLHLDCSP